MSKDVQEAVSRFWASYQSDEDAAGPAEPAQMVEDTQLHAEPVPLDPVCLKWWSALPVVVQKKLLANPTTPTIREAWHEHRKRQDAVNFARANVNLEGFKPSPENEALAVRFINGEIELSEVIGTVKE